MKKKILSLIGKKFDGVVQTEPKIYPEYKFNII